MAHPRMSERLMRTLAALACALLVLGAAPAFAAAPPEPERIAFGLVGIAFGQAIQVSVANTRLQAPPEPEAPPIAVEIVFLDGDGSVFKRSVQTIATGQSATLTLARGELSPAAGGRWCGRWCASRNPRIRTRSAAPSRWPQRWKWSMSSPAARASRCRHRPSLIEQPASRCGCHETMTLIARTS